MLLWIIDHYNWWNRTVRMRYKRAKKVKPYKRPHKPLSSAYHLAIRLLKAPTKNLCTVSKGSFISIRPHHHFKIINIGLYHYHGPYLAWGTGASSRLLRLAVILLYRGLMYFKPGTLRNNINHINFWRGNLSWK